MVWHEVLMIESVFGTRPYILDAGKKSPSCADKYWLPLTTLFDWYEAITVNSELLSSKS